MQTTVVDSQSPARASKARAADIQALCALAGKPELAKAYINSSLPVGAVTDELAARVLADKPELAEAYVNSGLPVSSAIHEIATRARWGGLTVLFRDGLRAALNASRRRTK